MHDRKALDATAYALMVLCTALWGFQQVAIKVVAADVSLVMQGALSVIVSELNYSDLDQVPGLAGANTTAENVAAYCWRRLADAIGGLGLLNLSVRIWENPGAYAAFEGAL